jgi:hypothetical protein
LAARRIAAVAAAAACALPAVAHGAALHPCGRHLECGRVAVPLDPSGRVPGRVDLAVRRPLADRSDVAQKGQSLLRQLTLPTQSAHRF